MHWITVKCKRTGDVVYFDSYESLVEARRIVNILNTVTKEWEFSIVGDCDKGYDSMNTNQPYGYLRENDGKMQISVGSERPADRSGGCASPWFPIYTAANSKGKFNGA